MHKYKYMLVGANGLLGTEFKVALGSNVLALGHKELDITDADAVAAMVGHVRPEVLINCAAWTNVDQAEANSNAAYSLNALGPKWLAVECQRYGITMVQISTDYVYGHDFSRRNPYTEVEPADPINYYGWTKLQGEQEVLGNCQSAYVLRTCGLYGPATSRKGNFINTVLKKLKADQPLEIVNDQFCTPTYAFDLARGAIELVAVRAPYGLYHMTNTGSCSWYEFALKGADIIWRDMDTFGRKMLIKPTDTGSWMAKEKVARARRPHYSVLSTDKLKSVGGILQLRPWDEALMCYLHTYWPGDCGLID